MKKLEDILLQSSPFEEILMGNQAIVRAMIETHTRVVTSYPGSPTPEIASAIYSIPDEKRPFYFEFSVNEKVATEVAFGAALNGNLSCVFFKSVGLNVALDSFVQLPLMNIIGGMVLVIGDDPGANSSQNEQDNRNVYKMSRVTVFEPANPAEAYAYYKHAAALAVREQTIVVLRLTTHVCHARQKISFKKVEAGPDYRHDFHCENGPYIALTSMALEMKKKSMEKLEKCLAYTVAHQINQVIGSSSSQKKGVIVSGLAYLSLMDALEKSHYQPDILKLGVIHPLEKTGILAFLKEHDQVLVLEELDNLLELEIKTMAYDAKLGCKIIGKTRSDDYIGEYTPDKVYAILQRVWPDLLPEREKGVRLNMEVPPRPAQMCPGCGHRSAFFAIKKALEKEDVTVADIGCHTLGYMPPYNLGEILLCMGASSGMASGLALKNTEKRVVAFLGDSTFFHAGLPGLINTVFNNHNITLILMENKTTAMTGHQDHAGEKVDIKTLLKALGIDHVVRCDTYNHKKLTGQVKDAMAVKGISVVIASHPCMLKFTRMRQKKEGYVQQHVTIDPSQCNQSHICLSQFGCPSFRRSEDGQVDINLDLCIGDGSCRVTCPKNAIGFDKGEQ
jgi:indolepyruvate ferredoxin oxidoreductase alpha subunit